jgi:hypothetical protein
MHPAEDETFRQKLVRFLLGGSEHEFTGDPTPLMESLRELLGCEVVYKRDAPGGARWVADPAHPAGGYEQGKPRTISIEVIGSRLGDQAVAALVHYELTRLGHPDVAVQLDT